MAGQVHPRAWVDPQAALEDGVEVGAFAVVEAGARVGSNTRLGAYSYVGKDVTLGSNCVLETGAVVLPGTTVGDGCQLQEGCVLGSTGFGFVVHEAQHLHIPQVSGVQVGSQTVIGAATCVDRGTLEPTVIGSQVRLGAQVQVAHNVTIGDRTSVDMQSGFAGSSTIGSDCQIGMQVGMAGHSSVGDRSRLAARTGNLRKAPADSDLWGFPARPRAEAMKAQAALSRLAKLTDADA